MKRQALTEHQAHPANVPGDFYVEDGCCTMCTVPFQDAPDLFGTSVDSQGYPHCHVKRQPETPEQHEQMFAVIEHAELECIRYRGSDRLVQLRLAENGEGDVCDRLPDDLRERSNQIRDARHARVRVLAMQRFRYPQSIVDVPLIPPRAMIYAMATGLIAGLATAILQPPFSGLRSALSAGLGLLTGIVVWAVWKLCLFGVRSRQ
jgi:hypothetical protein